MDDKDREAVRLLEIRIFGKPREGRRSRIDLSNENARRILALAKRALQMEEGGYYSIDDIPFCAEAPDE